MSYFHIFHNFFVNNNLIEVFILRYDCFVCMYVQLVSVLFVASFYNVSSIELNKPTNIRYFEQKSRCLESCMPARVTRSKRLISECYG